MAFHYLRLENHANLPGQIPFAPYKALVVVDCDVDDKWQGRVSEWLIDTGCLVMTAWGRDCCSWDDSVDLANLQRHDYREIPDASSIMTTWHEDETLAEVMWFARFAAFHPVADLENLLVLHIGSIDRSDEFTNVFSSCTQ
ncbi:DUF7684 family protein [Roseibium sp.]|uniref:DUF7684 family protein n=1 Tax=Roseibium sp. TaxID=1936156 RepID=UPI003D13DE89